MRELISLKCQSCSRKNYYITKNRRKHPEKMVIKKFCPFCRNHTDHKETKV